MLKNENDINYPVRIFQVEQFSGVTIYKLVVTFVAQLLSEVD